MTQGKDEYSARFLHSNCAQHIKSRIDKKQNKGPSWCTVRPFPSISEVTASAEAKGLLRTEL